MPHALTDDGVRLYYEEAGSGTPVIFVHEYAGDHRAWETQMRHFSQRYRAITYAARGEPRRELPGDAHRVGGLVPADRLGLGADVQIQKEE